MTKALIIGGGVAGPVTAMALQKAGIDSVIFEANLPVDEDVGSYLTLATNGLDALHAIDVAEAVMAAGFPTPENVLLSGTGRRLGRVTNGGMLPDGTVAHTIKRHRLHRVLREEARRRGIPFRHGERLVGAEITSGRVSALFEDGARAEGDLLIGCDGVHSATRRVIDPDAPAGHYVGLVNFAGRTRGLELSIEPSVWQIIAGERAFFGYVREPGGGVVWFANVARRPVTRAERASTKAAEWQRQLIALFANDHGPASKLIAAGDLELVGENVYDLRAVPRWHRGPMVVIGDAAHAPSPSSGQGASMACEDGVILAKCLRDVPDPEAAFSFYEQIRRERVERIITMSARTSSTKLPSGVARRVRDLVLPLVLKYLVTERSQSWMHGHHIEWSEPIYATRVESIEVMAQPLPFDPI